MPAVNPVRLLVKLPVPEPSEVWLLLKVGFCEVLQQTPRAVTGEPPSLVTLPPVVAELSVMPLAVVVVTVAATADVVKVIWLP